MSLRCVPRSPPVVGLLVSVALVVGALIPGSSGCGGGEVRRPQRTLPAPVGAQERDLLVQGFAARAFGLVQANRLAELLLDDLALRDMLSSQAATQVSVLRHNPKSAWAIPAVGRQVLAHAQYSGACIQGLRVERADGMLSLTHPAWLFDRMLLVGKHASGGRVALWVEGIFVRTDVGLRALTLERVETPRRDHADLELSLCDLRVGVL